MPLSVEINVTETASPVLAQLRSALEDPTGLHVRMAERVEVLVSDYLRQIAPRRHATANRLGATPTGILEKASEGVESQGDRDFATITIRPGEPLARVFGDVVIEPSSGKKFLTIPVAAAAYGKRAREFDDLVFLRVGMRNTPVLAQRAKNGNMTTYYVLVKRVTQKQDRTLLPSDGALLGEMEAAAEDYLLDSEG